MRNRDELFGAGFRDAMEFAAELHERLHPDQHDLNFMSELMDAAGKASGSALNEQDVVIALLSRIASHFRPTVAADMRRRFGAELAGKAL